MEFGGRVVPWCRLDCRVVGGQYTPAPSLPRLARAAPRLSLRRFQSCHFLGKIIEMRDCDRRVRQAVVQLFRRRF